MRQRQSGQEGRQSCRVCNVCLVRTVPARCFFRRSQKSGVRCNLLQALRSSGTSRPTRAVFAVVRHLAQKKGSSKTPGCSVAGKGTDDMSKIGEHVRWELLRKPSSRSVWLADKDDEDFTADGPSAPMCTYNHPCVRRVRPEPTPR